MVTNLSSIGFPEPLKRTLSDLEFETPAEDYATFGLDETVLTTWAPEIEEDDWGVLSLYHSGVEEVERILIIGQCELPFQDDLRNINPDVIKSNSAA